MTQMVDDPIDLQQPSSAHCSSSSQRDCIFSISAT
jgi:hypothetical protein